MTASVVNGSAGVSMLHLVHGMYRHFSEYSFNNFSEGECIYIQPGGTWLLYGKSPYKYYAIN